MIFFNKNWAIYFLISIFFLILHWSILYLSYRVCAYEDDSFTLLTQVSALKETKPQVQTEFWSVRGKKEGGEKSGLLLQS